MISLRILDKIGYKKIFWDKQNTAKIQTAGLKKIFIIGLAGIILISGCVQQQNKISENKIPENQQNKIPEKGILEGKVTIGPLCAVERIPPDPKCQPTEETYKAWPIAVYTFDRTIKVAQIEPNLNGTYKIEILVGNYIVDSEKKQSFGIGGKNLPATISINSGKTTTLNIDIDTGLR